MTASVTTNGSWITPLPSAGIARRLRGLLVYREHFRQAGDPSPTPVAAPVAVTVAVTVAEQATE